MSESRLIVDHSFCENAFIGCRELHDFSSLSVLWRHCLLSDFSVITVSYFITNGWNGISITSKYNYVRAFADQ